MNICSSGEVASGTCRKVEPKCGKASYNRDRMDYSCVKDDPITRENKMKKPMLTYSYLDLMHSFRNHADYVLEKYKDNKYLSSIGLMQEYCTLRIDGGRQTGKTEAVAEFCKDWLSEGNDVIIISPKLASSIDTATKIKRRYDEVRRIDKELGRKIIPMTIRDYLSSSNKLRGISLNRVLIVIDEPMRIPEMHKFYSEYSQNVNLCITDVSKKLPLFFVMGIQ